MLTIRTTGDDAFDTDARLLNALTGFHVLLGNEQQVWEMQGVTESDGEKLILRAVDENGVTDDTTPARLVNTHNVTIEVL